MKKKLVSALLVAAMAVTMASRLVERQRRKVL